MSIPTDGGDRPQERRHLRALDRIVSILRARRYALNVAGASVPVAALQALDAETVLMVEEAIEAWAFPGDPLAEEEGPGRS